MWDAVFFCFGGVYSYCIGMGFESDVELLKSATRVNKLKDLAQLVLNTKSKVAPIVVISGRVGSETPIFCEISQLRGVIVKNTARLWFMKPNDVGKWIKGSYLLESICKEVPWYLDDGTGRAFVVGAQSAFVPIARRTLGSILTAGKEVFDGSVGLCLNILLGLPQGIKMLGVHHVERLLPIGASMTVIGEVVKDDTGIIMVRQPYNGHPFYICPETVDELIEEFGASARFWKCAFVICVACSVFAVAKHAVQYIWGKRLSGESQRRALSDGARRLGQDVEDSNGKSDSPTKDRATPGLRVICVGQEYNPRMIFKFSVQKPEYNPRMIFKFSVH